MQSRLISPAGLTPAKLSAVPNVGMVGTKGFHYQSELFEASRYWVRDAVAFKWEDLQYYQAYYSAAAAKDGIDFESNFHLRYCRRWLLCWEIWISEDLLLATLPF